MLNQYSLNIYFFMKFKSSAKQITIFWQLHILTEWTVSIFTPLPFLMPLPPLLTPNLCSCECVCLCMCVRACAHACTRTYLHVETRGQLFFSGHFSNAIRLDFLRQHLPLTWHSPSKICWPPRDKPNQFSRVRITNRCFCGWLHIFWGPLSGPHICKLMH